MYTINVNNFYTLMKKCFFFCIRVFVCSTSGIHDSSAYFSLQTDRRVKGGQNVY